MHVQLVTFQLAGIDEEQYRAACEAGAATFGSLPGLLAKVWLRDPSAGTYGGLYLWQDREAYERYVAGDVFAAVRSDAALRDVRSAGFGVFEELTKATQPGVLLV